MSRRELLGAYARGLYHACGVDSVEDKPLVGIANSWNDLVPGHIHLDRVAEAVKEGVRAAGDEVGEQQVAGVAEQLVLLREYIEADYLDPLST